MPLKRSMSSTPTSTVCPLNCTTPDLRKEKTEWTNHLGLGDKKNDTEDGS